MKTSQLDTVPKNRDHGGVFTTRLLVMALALAAIAIAGWGTVQRLAEVATGHDVSVVIPLTLEQGEWAIGTLLERSGWDADDQNEGFGVDLRSVTATVPDPSHTMLVALWADSIMGFLAVGTGVGVAAIFLLRVAFGRAFERGSARLVFWGTGIFAMNWILHTLAVSLTAGEARMRLLDDAHSRSSVPIDLSPVVWILFFTAVGAAFLMGERLRRDTEGLV